MNKKAGVGGVALGSISSSSITSAGRSGSALLIGFLIAVVFVALALLLVFTKRPWVDEAWFTGPALDLVSHGRLGTLLLDPAGSHLRLYKTDGVLQGINQHTYWVMPLHLLQLALWGKVLGFSIF